MKFKLKIANHEQEIEATLHGDELEVKIDGRLLSARLHHHDSPYFTLEYQDGPIRHQLHAAGHLSGDQRQLWLNGRTHTYQRLREKAAAGSTADNASLSATIPAVVSEVLVKVGDKVTAGDKLILLESMKMILPIVAPHDGVVKKINCTAGQAVQPGNPLVELE